MSSHLCRYTESNNFTENNKQEFRLFRKKKQHDALTPLQRDNYDMQQRFLISMSITCKEECVHFSFNLKEHKQGRMKGEIIVSL